MPEKGEKRTKLDRNEQNAIKSAIGTVLVAEQPSISVSNGLRHSFFTRKSKGTKEDNDGELQSHLQRSFEDQVELNMDKV